MTTRDPYGDALRGALHAEADRVTPSPDALHLIRARTARPVRMFTRAWLKGGWKGPLLASAAALAMAVVAVSATPAAIDRFSSAGSESKAEREAQQRKSAPLTTTKDGIVIGPDGKPLPSSLLRITCMPIEASTKALPKAKTPMTPAPGSTTCPPSMTPTIEPVSPPPPTATATPSAPMTPTGTPTPTGFSPTPTVTVPARPSQTPTAPEEPAPTAPIPSPTPS